MIPVICSASSYVYDVVATTSVSAVFEYRVWPVMLPALSYVFATAIAEMPEPESVSLVNSSRASYV